MSTIKRSKTDAFDTKQSVNIVKLAEAAFEQVSLDDLTDVVVDNPTDGDILVYNESLLAWENVPQMEFASNLTDLGDITITSVSDGQVLTYDSGTSKWVNASPVTGVTTLDGLSDVVITTASTGQVLKYNGTNWVNSPDIPTPSTVVTDSASTRTLENADSGLYIRCTYNGPKTIFVNDLITAGEFTIRNSSPFGDISLSAISTTLNGASTTIPVNGVGYIKFVGTAEFDVTITGG